MGLLSWNIRSKKDKILIETLMSENEQLKALLDIKGEYIERLSDRQKNLLSEIESLQRQLERTTQEYSDYKIKQRIYKDQYTIELRQMAEDVSCLTNFVKEIAAKRDSGEQDDNLI